ncbi:hypothetical protein B0T24DRAFT_587403 [Lasiosphaeria ovina]|uniref:T6SS Phospholipase effector Tle1-like catalytic domain-containing protein n=1 Tax=Lasiosphaeria ovina TaxID=92902 RepID=A0AAE0NJG1_9PEZI|nr:hypothetical protein B0T24DRAFT_587403 [Lasiosphaeria ovina]
MSTNLTSRERKQDILFASTQLVGVKPEKVLLADSKSKTVIPETIIPTSTSKGPKFVQRVVYQPGLGADGRNHRALDLIAASHFDSTLMTLYRYICTVWREGDELYFFGFSRGAYMARVLASFVHDVGVYDRRKTKRTDFNETKTETDQGENEG